jgi:hypothetical protein
LFWTHVTFLTFVSLAGIALGLFISAIPNISSKAAQNLIPIILIPQIILGGALIEFEQMNDEMKINKKNPIPEICQIMPSRWAYEGLMVIQAKFNRFDAEYDRLSREMNELKRKRPALKKKKAGIVKEHGEAYYQQKREELQARIDEIEQERDRLMKDVGSIYGNAKIYSKVAMADANYEKGAEGEYNMMVSQKKLPLIGRSVSTVIYNALVMGLFAAFFLFTTLMMLKYKEEIGRGLQTLRNFWRRGVQLRLAAAKG